MGKQKQFNVDKFLNVPASLFWIVEILLSTITIITMIVVNNNSPSTALSGAIQLFGFMLLFGLVGGTLTLLKIETNFRRVAFWWVIAFFGYYALFSIGDLFSLSFVSALQLPIQTDLAQLGIISSLPEFVRSAAINNMSPTIENIFILNFVMFFLIWGFRSLKTWIPLFENKFARIIPAAAISSALFAYLHLGRDSSFFFVAFGIMFIWGVVGWLENISNDKFIGGATILFASLQAFHKSNNILETGGLIQYFNTMLFSAPFEALAYPLQLMIGIGYTAWFVILGIAAISYAVRGFK